jgi:4-aminobutyrate aminotransferase
MATAIASRRPEIKTELPGPKGRAIVEADAQYVNPGVSRARTSNWSPNAAKAFGSLTVDGNVFLDCNAGVAVCSTGHCHPGSRASDSGIKRATDPYVRHGLLLLADARIWRRRLASWFRSADRPHAHFANSGTEAVECALKIAMHATGREKFISFFGSFHGPHVGVAFAHFIEISATSWLQATGA